ncbi:MAG: hypothetical protein LBS81_01075 [Endomicrobium sp.]|jgi:signal transduction histidine kinase|nr:hypothetical protein [Endomicrobium sp.]
MNIHRPYSLEINISCKYILSVLGADLIVRLIIKLIKKTDSLKDKFISHELKTPLFAIEGYCNLLIRKIKENYSCSQQIKGLNIIKNLQKGLKVL